MRVKNLILIFIALLSATQLFAKQLREKGLAEYSVLTEQNAITLA